MTGRHWKTHGAERWRCGLSTGLTRLGVVGADAPDESDVLGGDAGTAWLPALPGPVALMATPVPRNHGGRLDQNQGRAPVPPDFRERDPERPFPGLEPGPLLGSGVSRELLPKSEILEARERRDVRTARRTQTRRDTRRRMGPPSYPNPECSRFPVRMRFSRITGTIR